MEIYSNFWPQFTWLGRKKWRPFPLGLAAWLKLQLGSLGGRKKVAKWRLICIPPTRPNQPNWSAAKVRPSLSRRRVSLALGLHCCSVAILHKLHIQSQLYSLRAAQIYRQPVSVSVSVSRLCRPAGKLRQVRINIRAPAWRKHKTEAETETKQTVLLAQVGKRKLQVKTTH